MDFNTGQSTRDAAYIDLTEELPDITRSTSLTPFALEDDEDTIGFDSREPTTDPDDEEDEFEVPEELVVTANLPRGHTLRAAVTSRSGYIITPGTSIIRLNGSFFHVRSIVQNAKGEVYLRGFPLLLPTEVDIRISKHTGQPLCRLFPQQANELVAVIRTDFGNLGSLLEDRYLETTLLEDVGQVRDVIFTNREWPHHSYFAKGMRVLNKETGQGTHSKSYIEDNVAPVCRMKYIEELIGRSVKARQASYLNQEECDSGKGISHVVKKHDFLAKLGFALPRPEVKAARDSSGSSDNGSRSKGKKRAHVDVDLTLDEDEMDIEEVSEMFTRKTKIVKRGSMQRGRNDSTVKDESTFFSRSTVTKSSRAEADLPSSAAHPRTRTGATLTYTFGDLCAGGGCISRAAKTAGLKLRWALDHWDIACRSIQLNFPEAQILPFDIWRFVQSFRITPETYCTVLHFSPPCQGHSIRNRGYNPERDAINNAVCLALGDMLKKCRPRIVTMEQTDHIQHTNEGQYWRMLVLQCIGAGYSVRWTVLRASDQGSVQGRKRLIAMAACPGEKLPSFPTPTHGTEPGLRRNVTINQRLATIPRGASLHDPAEFRRRQRNRPRKALSPADGNAPLKSLIDTSGVAALHPDGDRWFTYREQMALMDLPTEHRLYGRTQKDMTTQIGNGVPVRLGTGIFREIVKSLEESDTETAAWLAEEIVVD